MSCADYSVDKLILLELHVISSNTVPSTTEKDCPVFIPMVGIVLTNSSCLSLNSRLVLPAPSRPSVTTRISIFGPMCTRLSWNMQSPWCHEVRGGGGWGTIMGMLAMMLDGVVSLAWRCWECLWWCWMELEAYLGEGDGDVCGDDDDGVGSVP